MKDQIISSLENPESLERLYRSDKSGFRKAFTEVYPDHASSPLARAWKLRLTEDRSEIDWGTRQEFMLVAILSLAAGSIAKLPDWFGLDEERYFSRNAGFIIFPLLTAFFLSRKGAGTRAWIALALA
ncbi:MAG: hypothetical protein ACKOAR_02070, partial [Bacteroidota bacterium]